MSHVDYRRLAELLRWNAARFRLPAHPKTWPDWMTEEKRISMANNFETYAIEADELSLTTPDREI